MVIWFYKLQVWRYNRWITEYASRSYASVVARDDYRHRIVITGVGSEKIQAEPDLYSECPF